MAANNTVTDFLLTKHIMLNSADLTALIELKEHLMKEDKALYNRLRNNLTKLISEQQAMHDLYREIIPDSTLAFWQLADKINLGVDEILLKK